MSKFDDIFNGNQYVRATLPMHLLLNGILDVSLHKKPRQITITYQHEGKKMKPIVIPVKDGVDVKRTIGQLGSSIEVPLMSDNTLTDLIGFLINKYMVIWEDICSSPFPETSENDDDDNDDDKKLKKTIPIKKYSENGKGSSYESVVLGGAPKCVTWDRLNNKLVVKDQIERTNDILIPGDTIDTQNPLPFIFETRKELEVCLEEARNWTLDKFFLQIESINRKYVDIEDHYHALLTGDMIWTWFQDKFGSTHYNILIGDNGSGKNSELLVFKFLGYRVFYTVSTSAANYYTKMGNVEEGQISIAEDEAEDIALDREKRNVFKSGYASGGSVPKVELEGGRRSEDWLTYCQKWVAMEELPTQREMKGVLDRSFVFKFVIGDPQYNIKDVLRSAGDPKFKPLYDELVKTRKLLFCYRLRHYDDPILDVKLNVKNRSAELTKPLIRLFQNSPVALERILDSLTKFMIERNEVKKGSFESKLYEVIAKLKEERKERLDVGQETDEDKALQYDTGFTNPALLEKAIEIMDCKETDKPNIWWSSEMGCRVTQTKITNVAKSKFKAQPVSKKIEGKTVRCLQFEDRYLKRIESSYYMPDKIEIIKEPETETETEKVTVVTPITLCGDALPPDTDPIDIKNTLNIENLPVNTFKNIEDNDKEDADDEPEKASPFPRSVTGVTSVTDSEDGTY